MQMLKFLALTGLAAGCLFVGTNYPAVAQPVPPPPVPSPHGHDPRHLDAEPALLAAFDRYEIVAIGAGHGNKDLDDFILHLIRNPALASKVNDIVVECGNSLYQPVLDRYIAGEDVPFTEVQKVWRDTTQSMCGLSAFYAELFPLVRRINRTLPDGNKLRVLAGDPPVDWSKVTTPDAAWQDLGRRESTITAVMQTEVLNKHRKALMLFGDAHLTHASDGPPSAVEMYEKTYPHVTLVVATHNGFGTFTPSEIYNDRFEPRLASWSVPSLAVNLKGTWLADLIDQTTPADAGRFAIPLDGKARPLDPAKAPPPQPPAPAPKFSDRFDAYLYLGPKAQALKEPVPASVTLDTAYMAELKRRAALLGIPPMMDQVDPAKIRENDAEPMLYGTN